MDALAAALAVPARHGGDGRTRCRHLRHLDHPVGAHSGHRQPSPLTAVATTYVALGDSISIDDYAGGPGRGGASLLYRNRDDDFPAWRGHDLTSRDPQAVFRMLATDGATTHTLLTVQLPRLVALDLRPTLVTVTVGGNDVLSAYGDTMAARVVIERVARALSRALGELHPLLAAGGRVIVGTVYDPSDGTGDATWLGLPPWPDAVRVVAELNAALREVAAGHDAPVAVQRDRAQRLGRRRRTSSVLGCIATGCPLTQRSAGTTTLASGFPAAYRRSCSVTSRRMRGAIAVVAPPTCGLISTPGLVHNG
jgi:lysophospholipase L1-like esterase